MFDWNRQIKRVKGWSFVSNHSGKHLTIKESEFDDAFQDRNGFEDEDRKKIGEMKIGDFIELLDCKIICCLIEN